MADDKKPPQGPKPRTDSALKNPIRKSEDSEHHDLKSTTREGD